MNSILIDFSGVFEQEGFTSLPSVDLRSLEGTNCYCSPEAAEVIKRDRGYWVISCRTTQSAPEPEPTE